MVAARIGITATALAAIAALAGCSSSASTTVGPTAGTTPAGGQSTGGSSAKPVAATGSCSVITQAQASAALGQPVKPPVLGKAFVEGGRACVFYGPNAITSIGPDTPQGDTVRVVLVTGPSAKRYFDDYRGKVPARPLSGLGDQAFYDGFASISVLKGDAYLRIYCGPAGKLGPEEQLARDALPRM
jgi:hypothetical protein